jgi:putative hemolysin
MIVELLVILCLFLLNGFFAMAELAIVSSRRGRLQQLAREGRKGATVALELSRDPAKFLSSVQIGITLIGILSGAFSGATIAEKLDDWLAAYPAIAPYAETLAIALTVVVITYFSLVIGELVPKHLALRDPERIAAYVARPIAAVAWFCGPLVWLLRGSNNAVLWALRVPRHSDKGVTEEEIRMLIAEGTEEGEIHREEHKMIEGVLRLADRTVRSVMTPRPDVYWIDPGDDEATLRREIRDCDFSRILVSRGEIDNVVGQVRKKDLLDQLLDGKRLDVMAVLRQPLVLPDQTSVLRALERFKTVAVHMAVVVDEYGSLEGIVTQTDILEAIAGDLPERDPAAAQDVVRRDDGSYLLDGALDIDDAIQVLGLPKLAEDEEGEFDTLAGLVLERLKRVPNTGDHFAWGGWRFEVVDMDGRRIDKVLAAKVAAEEDDG